MKTIVYILFPLIFISCSTMGNRDFFKNDEEYYQHYAISELQVSIDSKWIVSSDLKLWSCSLTPEFVKADIVLLHGYLDHSFINRKLLPFLLERNFRIILMDLPGHGRSEGTRGGLDDFSRYRIALQDFMDAWSLSYEETLFIGHSTGASIIIDSIFEGSNPRGVILAAPLLRFREWTSVVRVNNIIKSINLRLPVSRSPSSSNKDFNRWKLEDPLRLRTFSLTWPRAIIRWQNQCNYDTQYDSPMLVLQGEKDRVVFWKWNLEQIQKSFPLAEIKVFPNIKHHLWNESDTEIIFQEMDLFIKSL